MCQINLIEVQSVDSTQIQIVSQSFGELHSKNVSRGQYDVSKHLACRHILKLIVRELKEKNQKEDFFGT